MRVERDHTLSERNMACDYGDVADLKPVAQRCITMASGA